MGAASKGLGKRRWEGVESRAVSWQPIGSENNQCRVAYFLPRFLFAKVYSH